MTDPSLLIFDASAYRALARDTDAAGVRDRAAALARAERAGGARAVASPFALWSLLADVAAVVKPASERRGPSDTEHARAGRARLAVAACVAHCARQRGEPGTLPFVMAEDPDTRLCRALGVAPPPGLAAWNEYLASLAAEIAEEPTDERARRIGGPLAHVVERATQAIEDAADEMQDAVLAAYEAASAGWDDAMSDDARQQALVGPAALQVVDDDEGTIGEPLMLDVLRRDPLLRAVSLRRAARAHRFVVGASPDDLPEPTLAEAARVAEHFPAGMALGRELLRRVIAGDAEVAGRAARRWLWDLQVAYGLAGETGVTGSEPLGEALGTTRGVETLAAHRERVRA